VSSPNHTNYYVFTRPVGQTAGSVFASDYSPYAFPRDFVYYHRLPLHSLCRLLSATSNCGELSGL
jgi:hypothetical protein